MMSVRRNRELAEQHIAACHEAGKLDFPIFDHRKPPLPVWFYDPPEEKKCRWCGEAVTDKRRTRWHAACYEQYAAWVRYPINAWALWGGSSFPCAICGEPGQEVDHKRALINSKGDPTAHFMSNLRWLCCECHKAKTQRDMAEKRRAPEAHNLFATALEPGAQKEQA